MVAVRKGRGMLEKLVVSREPRGGDDTLLVLWHGEYRKD